VTLAAVVVFVVLAVGIFTGALSPNLSVVVDAIRTASQLLREVIPHV
jgi:hypothetical protein